MADLEPSAVWAVFERARKECKFFPQIAELREMAGGLTVQGELMEIDRAWFWVPIACGSTVEDTAPALRVAQR